MRNILAFMAGIAVAAMLLVGFTPKNEPFFEQQMRAEAIPTVRLVTASMAGSCSAVVVAPGYALSAQHCSVLPGMKVDGHAVAKISAFSTKDVILLDVPGLECPCAPVAMTDAAPGERVAAVGFPYGMGPLMTYGESQGNVYFEGEQYVLHTAGTSPGMSGGGVFVIRGGRVFLAAITSRSSDAGLVALSVNAAGLAPQLEDL